MVDMETQYGSLTRGMLAGHRKMKEAARKAKEAGTPARTPMAIFTTLKGGLQQLVDALVASIDPRAVRMSTPVRHLKKTASGWTVTANGIHEEFDTVIMASPAWAVSKLMADVDAELAAELAGIPYSSSITVNLLYDETKLGTLPEGFGFLVPASEGRAMLACTFVHRKFLGRTPPGKAVLRAFLGGMRNEALLDRPDDELVATVRRELQAILGKKVTGIGIEPEHTQVSRWRRAMAQYAPGHPQRTKRIAARVAALPGLKLAGNAYDGIGIPDCIRLGRKAAKDLVAESCAPAHSDTLTAQ
jgi:oxygen-dependent protoporphyrinogen oxidase